MMADKPVHERIAEERAHYMAHPDEDEWEEAPAPPGGNQKRLTGAMISVRLSAAEADEIRAAADAAGQPVSAFVRGVVLNHIQAAGGSATVTPVPVGNSSRVVGQVELEPGAPLSGDAGSLMTFVA
jgi:hypothetical protein